MRFIQRFDALCSRNSSYAGVFLRLGLAIVFLWFGIDKFFSPTTWVAFVPGWMHSLSPIDMNVFMYIQGAIETVIGVLLLVGYKTRLAAAGAAAILVIVIISVGLNELGLRDFALLCGAIALMLLGPGKWSVDTR